MQTFMPYPEFLQSAACLEWRRLGNQRREAKQIYLALTRPGSGWRHHPAVRMWWGHEAALLLYGLAICREWVGRGYRDSLAPFFAEEYRRRDGTLVFPSWLGDGAFHRSHRSNLLRKDPAWYGRWGWNEPPDLPYVWPLPGINGAGLPVMSAQPKELSA